MISFEISCRYKPTKKQRKEIAKIESDLDPFDENYVMHDYETTRLFHTSDKSCKSPYCGVCYDYFIDNFIEQKALSKRKGLKRKLSQSSIKFLEEKYGHDASKIFKNRFSKLMSVRRKSKIDKTIGIIETLASIQEKPKIENQLLFPHMIYDPIISQTKNGKAKIEIIETPINVSNTAYDTLSNHYDNTQRKHLNVL